MNSKEQQLKQSSHGFLANEAIKRGEFYALRCNNGEFEEFFSSQSDFYMEAYNARLECVDGKSSELFISPRNVSKSKKLENFLKKNRPPVRFYNPEEIALLVAQNPNSGIKVNYREHDHYREWEFILDSKKTGVTNDSLKTTGKKAITLTRGECDHVEPFLVVGYPARYEREKIIFYPKIAETSGDNTHRAQLEEAMLKLLDCSRYEVSQELEFAVKENSPSATIIFDNQGVTKSEKPGEYFVDISLKEEHVPKMRRIIERAKQFLNKSGIISKEDC